MSAIDKLNKNSSTIQANCDTRTQIKEMIHNEELFTSIFTNASVGIALEDCDGRFTLTNDAFDRMLGYGPGELIGVHCSSVTPPQDVVENGEWYQRFMDNNLSGQFYEKRYIRKDGNIIWADINMSLVQEADGRIRFFIVITRDITARVHMEEALRVSENRFRRLAENAHDIIFSMALPSGRYEYINPAVTNICGFTPEEHYNHFFHISQIVHPDFSEYINQQWKNLLLGKDVPPFYEFKIIHKNGSERWVHQRNVPIRDHEGSLIALEGIVTDITGQKLMEEALAKSEHRFRNLSEASLEAIVFIEDGVIIDANQALNRLFGYEGEDLRGKLATDFIVPERRPFTDERMRARTVGAYETFGLRKDGSTFPIEVNAREFEHGGKRLRISAVRDLTERRKIEEQLKGYQKHLELLVEERTNELKESEEKFRKIFENAIVGMYQSTPGGRFLRVNPALAQMYGYKSPKEIMQAVTNIATEIYACPEHRKDFIALVERDGVVRNYEIQVKTKDGSRKYVSVNAHAVRDVHGKTLYYEGIIEDITEKKNAMDQLAAQREIALKLAQTEKLEEGLEIILQAAIKEFGMECGGVSLKNTGTSSFDLVFSIGLSDEFANKISHILPGTTNWKSMASGKVLRICPSREIAPLAYEEGYKHVLIVPILLLEEVIGALVVASRTVNDIPDRTWIGVEYLAAEIGNIVARMQASQRLLGEIAIRKDTEQALTVEHRNLEEANTALKVLLKQREEDKKELEDKLIANTRNLILPFIHKLKESRLDSFQKMTIDLLESNLDEIVSPFLNNLRAFSFTPRQVEVIALIRAGKTTKEIAHFLSVGKDAVDMQRLLIRKKLGINNKKTNLRSYLQSLT